MKKISFVLLLLSALGLESFGQNSLHIFENLSNIGKRIVRIDFNRVEASDSVEINAMVDAVLIEYKALEGLDSLMAQVADFRQAFNIAYLGAKNETAEVAPLSQWMTQASEYFKQFEGMKFELEVVDTVRIFTPEDVRPADIDSDNETAFHSLLLPGMETALASADELSAWAFLLPSESVALGCCKFKCCKIKKPRITINPSKPIPSKPIQDIIDGVRDAGTAAVKVVADVIPQQVKEEATRVLGNAAIVTSAGIDIIRESGQAVTRLTTAGYNVYKDVTTLTNEQVIRLKDGILSASGITLPPALNDAFEQYITLHADGMKELYKAYILSANLQDDGLAISSTILKEFGRYLLMSAEGFPKEMKGSLLDRKAALAVAELDPQLLNVFIVEAFGDNFKSGSKDVTIVSFGTGTIRYDQGTRSIKVELTDTRIRQNKDFGLPRVSATLNVKKIKIQIVPSMDDVGNLILKPNLYYLDVQDLMPKFDEMLCHALQREFVGKNVLSLSVKNKLSTKIKVKGSDVKEINLSASKMIPNFFFTETSFGLALGSPAADKNVTFASLTEHPVNLQFSPEFVKNLVNDAIEPTGGIKVNFKSSKTFDETQSYYRIKELKDVTFTASGEMLINVSATAHFRKFLGRKPKVNLIFDNIGFRVTPQLVSVNDSTVQMQISAAPIIDKISLKDAPGRTKALRKVLKMFKKLEVPIQLDPMDMSNLTEIKVMSPIGNKKNLIKGKIELNFSKAKDVWGFSIGIR